MKVTYDKETDILQLVFTSAPVEESDEDKPGVIIDYDKNGNIVGMEIPIEALHGKFKVSQNRPREDHEPVIARLRERGGSDDIQIANLIEKNLKGKS
mgnify:CR=1 FL=1